MIMSSKTIAVFSILSVALALGGCAAEADAPTGDDTVVDVEVDTASPAAGGAYSSPNCYCQAGTRYCKNIITGLYYMQCTSYASNACGC
jgi:hypothetical protein